MMGYTADTQTHHIDPLHPDSRLLQAAADVLRRGGLVAFPTETVYGLGAHALDADAVARIFAAKGRPSNDPIIVHIHDWAQVGQIALDVPALAHTLAKAFMPGALTVILKRAPVVPAIVSSGLPSVAVRMPSGAVARALLQTAGLPIAAPSANTFSRPSATTAQHVLDDLAGRVDMVLDGGATAIGVESTVVDLTGDTPTVLRPGGIALEQLRHVVPALQIKQKFIEMDADEAGAAPGMLIKHYSPRARLLLFAGDARAAMRAHAQALLAQGQRVGVLVTDDERAAYADLAVMLESLGAADDAASMATRLFYALRALDSANMDVILARLVDGEGMGAAINDRLLRAAEGRVIRL
jgi:L-threonylcarbamoyladenylate synthase